MTRLNKITIQPPGLQALAYACHAVHPVELVSTLSRTQNPYMGMADHRTRRGLTTQAAAAAHTGVLGWAVCGLVALAG
jgi:hypothetical protein